MRVLTFLHSFEPGGVERIALRLVRSWREAGVDAPLFMGRVDGAMRGELAADLDFDVPRAPIPIAWCETLWMIATLPRAIRHMRPDVMFCAGNSYTIVSVAMKLLLGKDCPPIVAKMSNDLDRRDMRWPVRNVYRLWLRLQGWMLDHFVGMEQPMEQEIAETISPCGCISIIPDPAVSLAQIVRLREARHNRIETGGAGHSFVAVGRLAPQKNFALMLEAFAAGGDPADMLTIYGDGPNRPALQALAKKLGLSRRVSFEGHVPDPASRLAHFDTFLLSSNYEGVPAVMIEALAAGLPIIATDCSRSLSALLDHGRLGRLVAVGDVQAFAEAIARAPALAQDEAASLAQARRFAIENASTAYLACFRDIADNVRRGDNFAGLTEA